MSTTSAAVVLRQLRGLATAEQADRLSDRQLLERFEASHEEAAFAALVKRHGPLVWGVCRRVLRNSHDAEDVFQATFLVLAQKAGSAGRRGSLGGWLHRVAFHAALKARARVANRQRHERLVLAPRSADPLDEVTGRELLAVLDEELARLPEKYRAPLVLCYLQSQTCDEAARHLHLSPRTLKRRLDQGRTRLRARLTRRGLALPAALLAGGLTSAATPAAVPVALTVTAVKAGLSAPGTASSSAAALAARVVRTMDLVRFVGIAAVVLAAMAMAVGAFALTHLDREPRPGAEAQAAPQKQPQPWPRTARADAEDQETMAVGGRVLDSGGKPVAGAEVVVMARGWNFVAKDYQALKSGFADRDGRFRLTWPRISSGEAFVLAGKPGYGLSQRPLNLQAERQEMTLPLPPEQPLRGRLLDLQGLPAAGVRVWVMRIGKKEEGATLMGPSEGLPLWPKSATSDTQGRFTVAGLPRNQEVMLLVQGDRFAWQPLRLPPDNGAREMTWALSPGRLLQGKIVHEDTGKPAANARLVIAPAGITRLTDGGGRFRLSLPAVEQRQLPPLLVYPAEGEPYLPVRQEVVWPRGAVQHSIDVKVPRGVLVRGKVTEARSGRPVAGAGVQFVPREVDNPNSRPNVLTGWQAVAASGKDGSFRLAALPGPGHLVVSGPGLDFIHEEVGDRVLTQGKPGGARLYADGLVRLDLARNSEPKEVTVKLRRGVSVRGRLLGPGGKPVARAQMVCRLLKTAVPSLFQVEVQGGQFVLHGCDPAKDYPVYFLDAEDSWGATVTLAAKQAGGAPVTVRLARCGRAVARFVDGEGKPLKNQSIRAAVILKMVITPGPPCEQADDKGLLEADQIFADSLISHQDRVARGAPRTDAEGRFSYAGLIPGATYRLSVWENDAGLVLKKEFRVQAGKALDLGDVPVPAR
jgi:RNA polymerase sigma factor (sigma-70 family)